MSSARFVVRIPDLESGPKLVRAPIPPEWLDEILEDTEVRHAGSAGELSISATKNDADVLIRGKLTVTIQVPCARTLDPAIYKLAPEIFLLLTPSKRARDERGGTRKSSRKPDNRGKAKPGKGGQGAWDADPELSDEHAATDTYSGDEIVLDPFLREFILLEVPMVPLREDLRDSNFEATPPLPEIQERGGDPRFSPLALLKDRLEKKD